MEKDKRIWTKDGKLKNKKHEFFCQEFLIDFNQTQAAIRVGYSEKTAGASASRLLKDVNIATRVRDLIKDRADRLFLTQDNVVCRLFEVYDRCIKEQEMYSYNFNTKTFTPTGETSIDSKGALRALELLGKHLGMFNQNINLNADMRVVIQDDITND